MDLQPITDFLTSAFPPQRVGTATTALFGTLVGGLTTFLVQTRLKKREQTAALKDRLRIFVMVTSQIITDMDNIQGLVELYRRENRPEHELWKVVHTIDVPPTIKPEITQLDALISLGSGRLLSMSMHVLSEYSLVFGTLERYNGLRKAFIEARRKADPDDEEIAILAVNVMRHLEFIIATSSTIKIEAKAAQHLLFVKSQKHFGNAQFLSLSDD